ncbi:MAG: indole-3-glycerol-phosphate synthase [Phycisphaerales bacterium JB040]
MASDDPARDLPPTLAEIVAHKRTEIEAAKARTTLKDLEIEVAQAEPPRNFFAAVVNRKHPGTTAVIAEVKRKSPSAGWMRPEYEPNGERDGFEPEVIAQRYSEAGASAISCLTDHKFFGGNLGYIQRIKDACPLPVLRKDFILDPWQMWESRAAGADAVLLIAECLTESAIVDLLILGRQLQLTTLLEVHSMENLLRVRPHIGFPHAGYNLLGINNRDLTTMTTDVSHTTRLVDLVDEPGVLVSESGIRTPDDLARLRKAGVHIVLVGEHLMRREDPGAALAELLASGTGTP